MGDPDPSLENQRLVYDFISRNPGVHLRRISRDLGMHMGTLRYHVSYLERKGLIVGKSERNLKIYFAASRLSTRDQRMATLLQQKRLRDIIVTVLSAPATTHSQMVEALGLKASTLSKYTALLEERGILSHERDGREKRYHVTDEDWVVRLLVTYRRSFWDAFVDNALELYFER